MAQPLTFCAAQSFRRSSHLVVHTYAAWTDLQLVKAARTASGTGRKYSVLTKLTPLRIQ